MAVFKKQKFSIALGQGLGVASMDVVFNVNTKGHFYSRLPTEVQPFFRKHEHYDDRVWCEEDQTGALAIYAPTLLALENILEKALRACNEPTITEEHVILYNIESHISFAKNAQGEIFPNATFEGAEWATTLGDDRYGGHHASNRANGGYSLTVGAMAMTKLTKTVGEKTSVSYRPFNKGASHFNATANPAVMLNAWSSFSLPERPKEMPYSDEAAIFFHNLMFGMAKLSKMIQESTYNQEDLLILIQSNNSNLLGSQKKDVRDNFDLGQSV